MSQRKAEVSACAKAERIWVLQPREEKVLGTPKGRLKGEHRYFGIACCDGTRGNGFKLRGQFRLGVKKEFCTMMGVKHRNKEMGL